MRRAAMDLPGGHLSEMEIRERCKHLEEIANEQRYVAFPRLVR